MLSEKEKMKKIRKEYNSEKIFYIVLGIIIFILILYGLLNSPGSTTNITNPVAFQIPNESSNLFNNPENLSELKEVVKEYESKEIKRVFEWDYGKDTYEITLTLYPEAYEAFKERERIRDYDLFASDYYSKHFITFLTNELKDFAEDEGLSKEEIPYFIISFIQSLPYTSDEVTTGFDEYPRFPYETIYDDGGDCEDTSILASAMLYELGYEVVLLEFPEHLAVGVRCSPSNGQVYYSYQGIDYCYLETTGENWEVGKVPENIESEEATVYRIIERPFLDINFESNFRYNSRDVYTDVNSTIKNLGSKTAQNTNIYVALQTRDESKVWDSVQTDSIWIGPEETYFFNVTNLHSPGGKSFRIYVRAFGDNIVSDEAVSDWIDWE